MGQNTPLDWDSARLRKVQNSRLCVSRDQGCNIWQTKKASAVRNTHTTAQISRSRGQQYPTSAPAENIDRAEGSNQEGTRAVQQIPHISRLHANAVHAQNRAGRHGTLAGQHVHGLPMWRRSVEKAQSSWYSSGTFNVTDSDKKALTHKKDNNCCTC